MMRMRRGPIRSASDPVTGAENADEYVRKPRNRPAAAVLPPSAMISNGAVGSSWNADRKTVNEKPHITKKRGVNRRSDNHSDFSAMTGSTREARHAGSTLASAATASRPSVPNANVEGSGGVNPTRSHRSR